MEIEKILIESLKLRGVFHSEADFQHHFAWQIQNAYKNSAIRLEYPISKNSNNKWEYCDIIIKKPDEIGIELKYKTKLKKYDIGGEIFELKNQGAQDLGRYDFLKDISRLENWIEQGIITKGFAIMLTNDKSYWESSINNKTVDSMFRLHNQTVTGKLSWLDHASAGTMKGRESPIILKNKYNLVWCNSAVEGFKYLAVEVQC